MENAQARMQNIPVEIGNSYVDIELKNFDEWLKQHKQEVDKLQMKTFNYRFHIVDGSTRYKLHRIRGKYVVRQCSKDYFNDKHDLINKFIELASSIKALEKIVDKVDIPFEEPKIHLDNSTKRFKV